MCWRDELSNEEYWAHIRSARILDKIKEDIAKAKQKEATDDEAAKAEIKNKVE